MSRHPTDVFRKSYGATTPLELNVSGPGWARGERRVFEQPFVLVGRHERSCLRLEDGAVSQRHAYLQQLEGRIFCVDLGSHTGTRWGGEPRPAGWLRPEQEIQIGPFTLSLAMATRVGRRPDEGTADDWDPLQDRVVDPRPLPQVTVEVGNEVLSHLNMNRVLVLVGSSPDCRIRLRDDRVSEYHCSLVRTPQGVWLVDLLNGTGTRLHGQPVAWALVKEGYRLQVGPYVLRVWYPGRGSGTPLRSLLEFPAETLVQPTDDTSKSGQQLSQDQSGPEPASTEVSARAPALQAERDQARERQRDAEVLRQQLADSQSECDRLRNQLCELEVGVAGMAVLQARLETAEARAGELDVVRGERDRWQAEAQTLQDRLASDSAEREEWRQRLEAAQQQLVGEREAVCAADARLDQESAALQRVRADLAVRNTEYAAALQRLKEVEDERACSQEEARGLQAGADQALKLQKDVEILRGQLADAQVENAQLRARVPELEGRANSADRLRAQLQDACAGTERLQVQLRAAESRVAELDSVLAECDRLRDQARALEVQVAGMAVLKARLQAAEARAGELDSVRGERDRWQAEVQTLQARLATDSADREQPVRPTEALHAAQVERDRLKTEQQASQNLAEQSLARVSDLGGALAEAATADATALEEVRAPWESEKQALEDRLEVERQTHDGAVQAEVPPRGRGYRLLDGLLAALVVVLAFLAASFAVRNGDFWFHLATGRLLAQGQFTFGVDPFAYTTQGVYWTHHAWLFDRLLYALYGWVGGAGLVLTKALLVAALAWLLIRSRRPGGSGWLPTACTALAVLAMSPFLLLRPACVSYVFLGLSFLLLAQPHADESAVPDNKHYLHLPLLFILWVNVDEWFLLGPILVVLFWVGERLQGCRRMPGWVVPVGLAACLVNPHGYHAFTLPAELSPVTWTSGLRHDVRFQQMFASPWQSNTYLQPATWQNAAALAYFALTALGLVSFLLRLQALRGWRFLVWACFGVLAAWQMRTIPFFAVVAGPITALNLQDFGVDRRRSLPRMSLVGRLALLLGVLGLILLAWPGWLQGYYRSDRHVAWDIEPDSTLRRAAEVLHSWRIQGKLHDGERVFALDPEVAEYSSWFCPGVKHFFDHRYPLFPQVAREYEVVCQALIGDRTGEEESGAHTVWLQILRDRNVSVVVLYDPDARRLRASEQRLAGDPQHWVLLDVAGSALFFGWKEARPRDP
jgi:pSer/pThr/pTyr-binding forkhead associated (FHA) protein